MGQGQSDPNQPSGPGDNPTPGQGRRPLGEKKPFSSMDVKPPTSFNEKGRITLEGYAEGQNFKKRTTAEMTGEIQQASQEAPEAVEHQRIPKSFRDSAKGYFQNLGGQQTAEPKKP